VRAVVGTAAWDCGGADRIERPSGVVDGGERAVESLPVAAFYRRRMETLLHEFVRLPE
jgi:hypothetical protein